MEQPSYAHELTFESEHILDDQIYGSRPLKKLEIYPNASRAWSFTLLSAFLNELDDFTKPSRRGCTITFNAGRADVRFSFVHGESPKYYFVVKITEVIKVVASLEWLKKKWIHKRIVEFSKLRIGGKYRTVPKNQILDFYTLTLDEPTEGTKRLFLHESLLYCSHLDFSTIFHFFTKKMSQAGLAHNIDTCSIHEYFEMFVSLPKSGINSLKSLKERVHGYLKLDLQESTYKRRLTSIEHGGKRYYIVCGVYISPLAKEILLYKDQIKGLLLDTTWKVMPVYVTSLIMG